MRHPGHASRDPLLKLGAAALGLALLVVAAVAAYALLREKPAEAAVRAVKAAATSEPLARSDPGVDPWVEEDVPPPDLKPEPEPEPEPPAPRPEPEPRPEPQSKPEPVEPVAAAPDPPEPREEPGPRKLPAGNDDWPMPTEEQVEETGEPRRYDLPDGAALGLSVPSIGLRDVPVLRSNTQRALDNGVVHARGTSMPWSRTPERNVYLAGHRLGWPGTGSHLVFYRLNELGRGDEVTLKSREGKRYAYKVTEAFAVDPDDAWVMGRIRDRDMLTLQTCTPIPGFQKRLIVRAERV